MRMINELIVIKLFHVNSDAWRTFYGKYSMGVMLYGGYDMWGLCYMGVMIYGVMLYGGYPIRGL